MLGDSQIIVSKSSPCSRPHRATITWIRERRRCHHRPRYRGDDGIELPGVLGMIAGGLKDRLQKVGQLLLTK